MTSVPAMFLENLNISIGDSAERPVGDVYFYTFSKTSSYIHLVDIFSNTLCSIMELIISLGASFPLFLPWVEHI